MEFIIVNSNNLPQHLLKVIEREKALIGEFKKLNERFETAENLKNQQEMKVIEQEGKELMHRMNHHIAEKTIVMTMFVGTDKNFVFN